MVTQSLAKQNYTQLAEDAVNQQIQMYQMAQQTYIAAAAYFNNAEVALPVGRCLSLLGYRASPSCCIGLYKVLS